MTLEQKQIAIAEFDQASCDNCGEILCDCKMVDIGSGTPDYLTSRDAICGAVTKLGSLGKSKFVDHLISLDSISTDSLTFNMITATPAQLADALLLTLGYET